MPTTCTRNTASIDSDHVFVNIWAEPKGHAWSYQAAYDLVLRVRARTGIAFDPHWFRHSAATRWLRDGVSIEVVSKLLGHSSVTTTSAIYGHLTAEDARAALEKAGWLTGKEGVLVTGGWITQADRERWQRDAVRELAAILDAHPGLPLIAWAVGQSGGSLAGRIAGPFPVPARGPRSRPGSRPWAWKMFSRSPPLAAGPPSGCVPAPAAAASVSR